MPEAGGVDVETAKQEPQAEWIYVLDELTVNPDVFSVMFWIVSCHMLMFTCRQVAKPPQWSEAAAVSSRLMTTILKLQDPCGANMFVKYRCFCRIWCQMYDCPFSVVPPPGLYPPA